MQFEGCAAEPLRTITAILPASKWSCLLLRILLQDALSEVTVFREVVETAQKVMKKLKGGI